MNRTFHIGNLTRDPETRSTSTGKAITTFSLAVQDGKETIFLDFESWEKTAELVAKYKKKGEPLGVEGRLKVDSWEDKTTGAKRSKVVIVAERVDFISGGGNKDGQKPAAKTTQKVEPENDESIPF